MLKKELTINEAIRAFQRHIHIFLRVNEGEVTNLGIKIFQQQWL
jgi:hypothetical protein